MDEREQEEQPTQKSVFVNWQVPDDMKSQYANNVFVQQGEYEFIISFFETRPPIFSGTPKDVNVKLAQLESIDAECVGRFVVSPKLVQKIIDALQTTLKAYEAAEREEGGGHTNGS